MQWVEWLIAALGVYLALGDPFAGAFVVWGAGRISPPANDAGWGFRLLIVPGSAALWPWLAWRWIRGSVAGPDAVPTRPGPRGDLDTRAETADFVDPDAETAA